MPTLVMANDKFNSGLRQGFTLALYAVRNIDKNIEYPETHGGLGEISWQEQHTIYNAQKDLLYKIYESIKKQQEESTNENNNN